MMANVTNERFQIKSNTLHLTNADDEFQLWLNTEASDFDGLIIGTGDTRQAALVDAVQTLNKVLAKLLKVIE